MRAKLLQTALVACALVTSFSASADIGVGVKAGTLGVGLEGRWDPPVPWFDVRVGMNKFDFGADGDYAGIAYDSTLAFDNLYLTGNFKIPLSPLRFTVGAYSNGNELQLTSMDTGDLTYDIGGVSVPVASVGELQSVTSFDDTAPYAGIGFDFEVFGKAGLNLDFGVLWQGDPTVSLAASNFDSLSSAEQVVLGVLLERERLEIQDDISDYKAWPVVSLSFVYNF
jgi:hypothetical protein